MDLYPFYPPLVKVIRPRLQRSMMIRDTTMEIHKQTYKVYAITRRLIING